jgi:hypothetical protein
MSVTVAYPVEVKKYQVLVGRQKAEIQLAGVEVPEAKSSTSKPEIKRVGIMHFGDPNPIGDADFITRGGFLRMDRPLEMFTGVLDLLRNEKPLFLREDGVLTTSLELVGEGSD